jgi:hypothetical protein
MRPKGNRVTRQRPHIGCGALRTGVLRGLLAELVRRALRRQTTPSRLLPDRLDVSREHPTTGFVVETLNESSDDLARRLRFDRVEKPPALDVDQWPRPSAPALCRSRRSSAAAMTSSVTGL